MKLFELSIVNELSDLIPACGQVCRNPTALPKRSVVTVQGFCDAFRQI
jgi:hypothetical protein